MFRITDGGKEPPSAESVSSRKEGIRPIAVCKGGPWNNKIIWLADKDSAAANSGNAYEGLAAPKDTEFMPLPETRKAMRDVMYITGASGTGKSTFAAECLHNFIRTFSTREKREGDKKMQDYFPRVVIVCPEDPARDPVFDDIGDFQWIAPKELLTQANSLDSLESPNKTVVIFDDIEGLSNKLESKALEAFSQMLLERGRKRGIYVYFISHRPASGLLTKVIIQEQNSIWFPSDSAAGGNIKYCLEKHMGIPKELWQTIKKHSKEFGRWVMIKTDSQPRYAITPNRIFIVDEDDIKTTAKIAKKIESKVALEKALADAGLPAAHHKKLATARKIKDSKYRLPDNVESESSSDEQDSEVEELLPKQKGASPSLVSRGASASSIR